MFRDSLENPEANSASNETESGGSNLFPDVVLEEP
jgi:hypothetical protein